MKIMHIKVQMRSLLHILKYQLSLETNSLSGKMKMKQGWSMKLQREWKAILKQQISF